MFQPSCKKKCWCIDGDIGCVPACPHERLIPRADRCRNAHLQKVPGQCCDQWACQSSGGEIFILPLEDFWNEYVDDRSEKAHSPGIFLSQLGNGIRDGPIYEDEVGYYVNELRDDPKPSNADYPIIGGEDWSKTNLIPGDIDGKISLFLCVFQSR